MFQRVGLVDQMQSWHSLAFRIFCILSILEAPCVLIAFWVVFGDLKA
jgi:hypothetical protein